MARLVLDIGTGSMTWPRWTSAGGAARRRLKGLEMLVKWEGWEDGSCVGCFEVGVGSFEVGVAALGGSSASNIRV